MYSQRSSRSISILSWNSVTRTIPSNPSNWRSLYDAALSETDRCKLPDGICAARSAILKSVENGLENPLPSELRAFMFPIWSGSTRSTKLCGELLYTLATALPSQGHLSGGEVREGLGMHRFATRWTGAARRTFGARSSRIAARRLSKVMLIPLPLRWKA